MASNKKNTKKINIFTQVKQTRKAQNAAYRNLLKKKK